MKLKTIDIHGFTGSGATLAEARSDAMRKVGAAIEQDYTPTMVSWRGFTKLIWMTPQGICSAWMRQHAGEERFQVSGVCHHAAGATMETERQWACIHLAQEAGDNDSDSTPEILADCEPWAHGQWWSWVAFQRAYRAAPGQLVPNDRHRWACDHAQDFSHTTEKAA